MDIGKWLRSLGLEQYEALFHENAIDCAVLSDLKEDHLREMGLPLGVRLKLMKAISALGQPDHAPPADLAATHAAPAADSGERRQVTVMFSDLVGSTALSTRMDPEDLREIISAYQKCVAETVGRFGGFVAKYMGDGVLVYFGYPEAHEDDAERSVRAGLELIAAVSALGSPVSLQTRVGIATGLVIVGDLIGSGEAQERGIVGETPNLAARLQGVAEPNTVVIAESTRKLLGSLFELTELGPSELKGIVGLVRPFAVLRRSSMDSRFEALHTDGLTALVGREEETELLLKRWAKAKTGEGQVVLLSGEAGIGKSRLTAALLEHLADEPHTRLRYFCSPQHTDSAFYPIIGQIQRAAGVAHDDPSKAKLDKLDTMLAQTSTSKQDAALVAEMLSVANDGRYPALHQTAEQRRQKTLEALSSHMEALTRAHPVLMIFEDVHWIDPTTLEALGRAVERADKQRALLLVTFRPEFEPPWIGRPYVTTLTINRLAQRDIDLMIDRVVGNKLMPANVRQDIVERTDGIPLFVEEMTKAVLEAGSEREVQRTVAAAPSAASAVPASLHASLMARLDRLGPAKEVAQIGAVIGREFSHALLAAVVRKPEAQLQSAIDRLASAGLLFRQGVPPQASYLFKHALVQDAAYSTLLREPRRALHARIAQTLEDRFPETAESQPELVARHCTEAGLIEKAVSFWAKAGLRSLQRSALAEGIDQLTRALALIATLPATPALRREEMSLQAALVTPLMHVKGYAATETKEAAERARHLIERAEALGEAPKDPLQLFSVLYSFWVANFNRFNGDVVCDLAAQFLALAEKQDVTAAIMMGHRLVGVSQTTVGNIPEGRAHFESALMRYDPVKHRPLATRFGQDIRVAALSYRSWVLWMLGYPDAALADAGRALKDAREVGHAIAVMYSLYFTSFALIHRGDYDAANAQLAELAPLAEQKNASQWRGGGIMHQGWVLALTGNAADAVPTITEGIAAWKSSGSIAFIPWYLSTAADAHAERGRFDDAWRCIDEAKASIDSTKERWCEPELHRIAGKLSLTAPDADVAKAEACFEHALALARAQQTKSFELRAAMSMARLWQAQSKRDQARELLAPLYNWFTEGHDTRDLKDAKALLDELTA